LTVVKHVPGLFRRATMQVLPTSDLHLNPNDWQFVRDLLSSTSFDVLICAGDIWEGEPEKAVQTIVELATPTS
jgi:predicted phosphodiesterase